MGVIERIAELQQQGLSDADITSQLQNDGVTPAQISDGFNQLKIKSAVAGSNDSIPEPLPPTPVEQSNPVEQQGLVQQENPVGAPSLPPPIDPPADQYAQAPGQAPMQEQPVPAYQDQYQAQPAQDVSQEYYPQTPQAYPNQSQGYDQNYYAPGQMADNETISEIASQVVTEKFAEFNKETGDIKGFQELIKEKTDRLDRRLKKIEDSFANLTQSIIGKVGEFGQNTALIHKDLDNLHGIVSKLMDKKIDHHHKKQSHTKSHSKKKKK